MKKNSIVLLFMVACLSLTITSCYYDKRIQDEIIEVPEVVSYANDIQPIWNSECVSCHAGNIQPDLTSANSYNDVMSNWVKSGDAAASTLYKTLIGEAVLMPPSGKLSQTKINLVAKWINDGALNN